MNVLINKMRAPLLSLLALILLTMTPSLAQSPKPAVKKPAGLKFLALGDSYTIGESVAEEGRWPNQLADTLKKKGINITAPKIIATTGWRTDDLKNAMTAAKLKNEYDLVSLLIGVNNQYQERPVEAYAKEFEALLKTAIVLAKGKKANVFVVSIPDYGYTPFGKPKQEVITKEINEFNATNKSITAKYGVTYVNITDISREAPNHPDYVAPDGLHPSAMMYSLWVKKIASQLRLHGKE